MARTAYLLLALASSALAGCHALTSARVPAADTHAVEPNEKAVRVEVTPARGSGRVGSEQVFVATVYDADGNPRRSRKVEWSVTGPGRIAAVDESGWLRGRGYIEDDTHAVSYTDYREHTITHGPHEITIGPGQTWLIVTANSSGEATVTAHAPDVVDRDQGRAIATLTFDSEGSKLPPPVLPDNTDSVAVTAPTARRPAPREDTAVSRPASTDRGPLDPPAPRSRTPVGEAALTFDVQAPKVVAVDGEAPLTVVLANTGTVVSAPATVRVSLPDAVEFVRADPPPTVRQGRGLSWNLGGLTGGKSERLTVTIRPIRPGGFTVTSTAETASGMYAEQSTRIDAGTAGLQLTAEAPGTVGVGDAVTVQIGVSNRGSVPLSNATVWMGLDPGLVHASGDTVTEMAVGSIGPGETRRVDVKLTAKQSGRHRVRVNATADGGLTDRVETTIDAQRSEITVAVSGPDQVTLKQDATWEVRVKNAGDGPIPDAVVRATLPRALRVKSASDGGTVSGTDGARWTMGTLAAGETKSLRLTATGEDVASRSVLTATATGGRGLTAHAETVVAVSGQAALVLETSGPPATVPVGRRAPVRVTVRNRGTGPAKDVTVIVTVTDELATVGGIGADRKSATATADKLTFGTLAELPAGATAVFVAEVEGAKPGSARVEAETRADHLARPLREEQPVRVVSR